MTSIRELKSVFAALTAVVLGLGAAAAPADAQRQQGYERGQQNRSSEPGKFDYYSLVLSWSPSYCADSERANSEAQCNGRGGRPYAFVLHGLWPQFEQGYPESCRTRERPYVPQSVIDKMQDIMPSKGLTIHEYRKHGTCSGLDPAGYYDLSRKLFAKVKIPEKFVAPPAPFTVGRGEVVDAFVAANPGLKPEMLGVACRGSGNRLREIRVCFSREGEFRSCGRNEDQRRLCSATRLYVPPVRLGAGARSGSLPKQQGPSPLPGPRMPGETRL